MYSELYQKLETCTVYLDSRKSVSNFVIKNELYLNELVSYAFDVSHKLHVKAFWICELLCKKKLKNFVPYIEHFSQAISSVTDESALRVATHIVFLLSKSNHRKNGISLTKDQELYFIESLFDVLIKEVKVASKVYAIKALFVFGKKHDWVHDELKTIISQDYPNHSAAYKTATRIILTKLNALKK